MLTYLIIIFIPLILAIFCNNVKRNIVLYYILCFILICYAGLRYRVGTDSFMYEEMFNYFPNLTDLKISNIFDYKLEPLYIVYISVCKSICDEYLFFQFVTALIVNVALFKFFIQNSRNPFQCVFIYILIFYLLLNCEFMRQALAISIFYLFAFPYLKKRKYIKYYVVCLISCFIHNSIYLCLIFPLVYYIRLSFNKVLVISTLFFIFSLFFSIFDLLSIIIPDNVSAAYKIISYSSTVNAYNLNFIILKLFELSVLLFVYFMTKKNEFSNYLIIYIFAVILSFSHDIFSRLQYVLSPIYIILLVDAIHCISKYCKIMIIRISFISLIAFFPTLIYFNHKYPGTRLKVYYKFFPYSSYLNPQKYTQREAIANGENQILYIFK